MSFHCLSLRCRLLLLFLTAGPPTLLPFLLPFFSILSTHLLLPLLSPTSSPSSFSSFLLPSLTPLFPPPADPQPPLVLMSSEALEDRPAYFPASLEVQRTCLVWGLWASVLVCFCPCPLSFLRPGQEGDGCGFSAVNGVRPGAAPGRKKAPVILRGLCRSLRPVTGS